MKVGEKTALCGVNEVLDSVLKTPPGNGLIDYSLTPKQTKQQTNYNNHFMTSGGDMSEMIVIICLLFCVFW